MRSFSGELRERIHGLAWSLWAELGVSGWERRHGHVAIDPEPLILFTAGVGDDEPRLRGEVIDWCVSHGRWVSRARLRNLMRDHPASGPFGELAATVNARTRLRWPGATTPLAHRPGRGSDLPSFTRRSLLSLRLRAFVGVTARAEILRLLLSDTSPASAADLAPEAAYTKRNIADALEGLRLAGIVESEPVANQLRYRLARPEALQRSIGTLPASSPRWRPLFLILLRILQVARDVDGQPPLVAATEAGAALHDLAPELRAARVRHVPLGAASGQALWEGIARWCLELVRDLAEPVKP